MPTVEFDRRYEPSASNFPWMINLERDKIPKGICQEIFSLSNSLSPRSELEIHRLYETMLEESEEPFVDFVWREKTSQEVRNFVENNFPEVELAMVDWSEFHSRRFLLSLYLGLKPLWNDMVGMRRITSKSQFDALYALVFLSSKDWDGKMSDEDEALLKIGVATGENASFRMLDALKTSRSLLENFLGPNYTPTTILPLRPSLLTALASTILLIPRDVDETFSLHKVTLAYSCESFLHYLAKSTPRINPLLDSRFHRSHGFKPGNHDIGGTGGNAPENYRTRYGIPQVPKLTPYQRSRQRKGPPLIEFYNLLKSESGIPLEYKVRKDLPDFARISTTLIDHFGNLITSLNPRLPVFPFDVLDDVDIPDGAVGLMRWTDEGFQVEFQVGQHRIKPRFFNYDEPRTSFYPSITIKNLQKLWRDVWKAEDAAEMLNFVADG